MLDTVLQIGKSFRESPQGLKHFKYVKPCPKDTEKNNIFRIALPINEDFLIDWNNCYEIIDEYEKNKLFYLAFKTSNSDGLVKYMFGDIFYNRIAKIEPKNIIISESGYFRLDNPNSKGAYKNNSFDRAKNDFEEIKDKSNGLMRFRCNFEKDYKYIERILKYSLGIEEYLKYNQKESTFVNFLQGEENLIKFTAQSVFNKIKSSKNSTKDFNFLFEEDKPGWEDIIKSEEKLKKLAACSTGNVFIHFEFKYKDGKKHWYELSDIFDVVKEKMFDDFVEASNHNDEFYVLKKTLYKTLCSGNEKNDIQFPSFSNNNKYKSKVFNKDSLQDLFYAIDFSENGLMNFYGTDLSLIVLPKGNNLKAEDFEGFHGTSKEIVLRRRNEQPNDDNCFSFLEASDEYNNITSFDMIFSKKGGMSSPDVDMVELRGVQKSSLKQIKERIIRIKNKINEKKRNELFTTKKLLDFSIFNSLQSILGAPQTDKKGKVQYKTNPKYQSHILKIIPKIYSGNYFNDPMLLPAFIENVEFSIRAGDVKYIWMKYDLEFLLNIQNTQIEGVHFMEIINSPSYKAGLLLGRMARNFSGENSPIKSFEKNYVGNLTRRISNFKDLIEFKNSIEEKLIMHEKINFVKKESVELSELIKSKLEQDYDKNECAFGFFENYFKYEKLELVDRIEKQLEYYKKEDTVNEDLINELATIISKHKKDKE